VVVWFTNNQRVEVIKVNTVTDSWCYNIKVVHAIISQGHTFEYFLKERFLNLSVLLKPNHGAVDFCMLPQMKYQISIGKGHQFTDTFMFQGAASSKEVF